MICLEAAAYYKRLCLDKPAVQERFRPGLVRMVNFDEFRQNLEPFHKALHGALLDFYSGRSGSFRICPIYGEYSDLFSPEAIRELATQIRETPASFPSSRKSLQRLHAFAAEQGLDAAACSFDQEIASLPAGRSFTWNGQEVPHGRFGFLIANEPDASRRRALQGHRVNLLLESAELRIARLEQLQSTAAQMGFGSYLEALQSCTGVDYARLSAGAEILLAASDARYSDELAESLGSSIGVSRHEASSADTAYWEHVNEPRGFFREELVEPALRQTISELGLRPEHPDAITFDLEMRPRKHPGFLCIPVSVPQEIHVLGMKGSGYRDFGSLLHEAGHAYHFAWTSPSLAPEYRLSGDRGLCEAFAFLFESLTWNENWLIENLGFLKADLFLRFQGLLRCHEVRREIGKLRFALSIFGPGGIGTDAPGRYAALMQQATGLWYEPQLWIDESCNGLRSADYLRGWIFGTALGDYFRTKYGTAWYRQRSAGRLLKEIWETGQLYSADELSRELGMGALDPQILADHLQQGLNR